MVNRFWILRAPEKLLSEMVLPVLTVTNCHMTFNPAIISLYMQATWVANHLVVEVIKRQGDVKA